MDEALTQLNKKLANKEHDLSEKLGLLYQRGQTIDQLEKELDEMFETDAQVRIMKVSTPESTRLYALTVLFQ